MRLVTKTALDIFPLSEEAVARLDKLKGIRDEDIDMTDMPELTAEQLSHMEPARFFEVRSKQALLM